MTDLEILYKRLRSYSLTDPARNRRWLDDVKAGTCALCGGSPCDPHHFLGSVHSLKSSDFFTVPVCRNCHNEIDGNIPSNARLIEAWAKLVHEFLRFNF